MHIKQNMLGVLDSIKDAQKLKKKRHKGEVKQNEIPNGAHISLYYPSQCLLKQNEIQC